MTQFTDDTWIDVALRNGTHLNGRVRQAGWLIKDNGKWCFKKADGTDVPGPGLERKLIKLLTHRRTASDRNLQRLLDLREDPECAIVAAMDYAKVNLDRLRARGYAVDGLNDVEKARIMYLCHHLGLADAVHFIQNTIPEADVLGTNKQGTQVIRQNGARKLLTTQVGKEGTKQWHKKASGNWVMAHRRWLEDFMNRTIKPSLFACPSQKQKQLGDEEENGALLDITEKLKK